MLKTPPRPRAPSTATLRFLYRLAYISSGTALGVGALCAEERRRRTQIVQRIADNAKRIRQSPRYARGVATAAAVREEEHSLSSFPGQDGRTEQSVKSAELPSVVEREYGQVVEKNHKRVRRRKQTGRPDFVDAHEAGGFASQSHERTEDGIRSPLWSEDDGSRPGYRAKRLLSDEALYKRRSVQGAWGIKKPKDQGDLECLSARPTLIHTTRLGRIYRSSRSAFEGHLCQYRSRHLWKGPLRTRSLTPVPDNQAQSDGNMVSVDIDTFFTSVTGGVESFVSLTQACTLADALLPVALAFGSYAEARSLLLWKIAIRKLSVADIFHAIDAFPRLAQITRAEELLAFYDNLLATPTCSRSSRQTQQGLRLALYTEALKLKSVEEYDGVTHAMSEALSSIHARSDSADKVVQQCQLLLDRGFLSGSMQLVELASRLSYHREDLQRLADALFDHAVKNSSLSVCRRVLVLKQSCLLTEHLTTQTDRFVQLCQSLGANGMLRDMFHNDGRSFRKAGIAHTGLSTSSYIGLCQAFAQDSRFSKAFNYFYRQLPAEARTATAHSNVVSAAAAMKADWRATRNLREIRITYSRLQSWASQNSVDINSIVPVHVAFAEILISANHSDSALELLGKTHALTPESNVGYTVALAFAKRQDWSTFQKLLESIAEAGPSSKKSISSTRAFNNALHLYSRSHSAADTSTLLKWAMDKLGFVPNKATWHITFSCFISAKNLQLVRDWLQMPAASGQPAKMDESIAATLVKRWHMDFRHSHVMIMWFCRALQQSAPDFTGTRLLNLVRESIGFDLRKNHGVNAAWLEPLILRRKTLVDEAGRFLPKPGYVWNGVLYDNGAALTHTETPRDDLQAEAARPSEPASSGTDEDFNRVVEAYNTDVVDDSVIDTPGEPSDAYTQPVEVALKPGSSDADADFMKLVEANHGGAADDDVVYKSGEPSEAAVASLEQLDAARESSDDDFANLRSAYASTEPDDPATDLGNDLTDLESLERNMILGVSLGRFEEVLDTYHKSLDAVKLPASTMVLEVAVEASIRLSGNRTEAERILTAAQTAGMNVSCAVGPLLIDQIRDCSYSAMSLDQARNIRKTAIEYYRMNAENGWHVQHQVGTKAAHSLIQAGYADHGTNLLNSIFNSQYAAEQPLDIAAMSVWLLGFAAVRHVAGIEWVVSTVFDQNMPINRGFLAALKRARRPRLLSSSGTVVYTRQEIGLTRRLESWRYACAQRRGEQMQASKVFGRKLITLLAKTYQRQQKEGRDIRRLRRKEEIKMRRRQRQERRDRKRMVDAELKRQEKKRASALAKQQKRASASTLIKRQKRLSTPTKQQRRGISPAKPLKKRPTLPQIFTF